jgi:cytochrome c biogenesis factor
MVIAIARISILEEGKVPDFEGKEKLDRFFDFTVSLAWLGLSTGIIVGAYWAYITLGWGGFWAWDPVETGSLVPWLFITLYFHGKPFFRKRDYLSNYLVSMGYVGALFVTYLTRSGVVSSVHAFVPGGALEKVLILFIPENSFIMSIILRVIPEERILFLLSGILVFFLLPLIIGIKNGEILKIPISLGRKDFTSLRYRTTALKISFIAFIAGTYIMILGLITPIIYDVIGYLVTFSSTKEGFWFDWFGISLSIDKIFYNTILTFFGGIMLLAQFFCTFYPRISIKRKFQLLFGGVIAGILFAVSGFFYRTGILTTTFGKGNPILVFLSNFWTTSEKANLVLPLLFLGIIGLIVEFVNISLKEEKNLLRKTSQTMLHLSFLLILVGALFSANMIHSTNIVVEDGSETEIPGTSMTITVISMTSTPHESGLHMHDYDTSFMISSGNQIVGYGISRLYVDPSNRVGHQVTILSNLFGDIYIVTTNVMQDIMGSFVAASLQIKIIPYINILWLGCILLHFAIIPLTIGRFILFKESLYRKEEESKDGQEKNQKSKKIVDNGGDLIDKE